MIINTKIQVGQMLSYPGLRHPYRVTSIRDNVVYTIMVGMTETEEQFGNLTNEGTPLAWSNHWICTMPTAEEEQQYRLQEEKRLDRKRRLEYAMQYL